MKKNILFYPPSEKIPALRCRGTMILCFILISCSLQGQHFKFRVNTGYGFYQLKELKMFQKSILNYAPVLPKAVEKFPGYLNYNFAFEYSPDGYKSFGTDLTLYNTGARNHIKDYSGEYKLDMLLNGYRIGISYNRLFDFMGKTRVYAQLKLGALFSRLQLKEYFTVYNAGENSTSYTFVSTMITAEPTVGITRPLGSRFDLNCGVGYEINPASRLHLQGHKDNYLVMNGERVYINWSGIRVMAGVGFKL